MAAAAVRGETSVEILKQRSTVLVLQREVFVTARDVKFCPIVSAENRKAFVSTTLHLVLFRLDARIVLRGSHRVLSKHVTNLLVIWAVRHLARTGAVTRPYFGSSKAPGAFFCSVFATSATREDQIVLEAPGGELASTTESSQK